MNRVTAVLLAAGALLVQMLAIYRDASGLAGRPYEYAYAAFRVGRNLAREGVLAWDLVSGQGGLASHPSPLLIGIAWFAERVTLSVTKVAQITGILCTLATVAISTRFDTNRIAGVVPALLLVSCGALAVAGPSGTEWAPTTMLLVTAFVAQEHRRRVVLGIAAALLVAARPEGIVMVLALATQCLKRDRRRLLLSHGPAVIVALALAALGANPLMWMRDALDPSAARAEAGVAALWDFLRTTVSPALLVFPLIALGMGELSGIGRRALALGSLWTSLIVLEGGGPWAMQLAFVPALPLVFIAVEQGIARALDTYKPAMERLAWVAIGLMMTASVLAARFPGDLGPLGLERVYERWLTPAAAPPHGHLPAIARASLHHELRLTEEAVRVGAFVRDHLPHDATLLTPWPGAIGYVSRVRVLDLYGRTTPLEGVNDGGPRPDGSPSPRCAPWWPTTRTAPILAALRQRPDFILPGLAPREGKSEGLVGIVARTLVDPADLEDPSYEAEVRALLAEYELIAGAYTHERGDRRPIYLLRRIDELNWPQLELATDGRSVHVTATPPSAGPPLFARLEVTAKLADGSDVWIDPRGVARSSERGVTRGLFVLDPGTPGSLELGRYPLPPQAVTLRARLVLPPLGPGRPLPFARAALLDLPPPK
ncbi:MAG: hypothetical protein R3F49_10400 [Planctomycetota bacterium]